MPTPRYEREIRSMLQNLPEFLNDGPPRSANRQRRPPRWNTSSPVSWTRDAYIMAALLILLAYFGKFIVGSVGAHLIAWIAAALIVLAVVGSIVQAVGRPRPPRMWRGKIL